MYRCKQSKLYRFLFQYCQKLKTIYVSDKWNNEAVTSYTNMFQGCLSLKGVINFNSDNANNMTLENYESGYFIFKSSE